MYSGILKFERNRENGDRLEKKLIILTGPTAVGKTDISIQLAKAVGGEIISADSMQVYKYMDIGTAKITKDEMQGIPHFLIDVLEPDEEFNVVRFKNMAQKAMDEIYMRGHIPIIVGGTGFYIQAILYDIDFTQNEDDDNEIRNKYYKIAHEKGNDVLHNMLREVDPAAADSIHANNVKRVARALEFFYKTGEKISEHNEEQKAKKSPYKYVYFVLNDDRQKLYERINKRVDIMFEMGLEDEVKKLKGMRYTKNLVSMQGIGYKEMFDYLEGQYDCEQAKYIIKRDTRHFAKRQITWFKRENDVDWMNYNEYANSKEKMLEGMLKILKEREII